MTNVIGYIRVSTNEQELSPAAQRQALTQWCIEHDAALVEVHEDIAKKGHHGDVTMDGGLDLAQRPGLLAAIEATKNADVLLVAKRDRLARSVMLSAIVDRLVEQNGARICTVSGLGDGDTPESRLLRQMVDAFAEFERSQIAQRTRAAMAQLKRDGRYTGGKAPYGYDLVEGELQLNAGEQRMIARAQQLKAIGLSLRKISARMATEGMLARNGKPFHAAQVSDLLQSEVPS